MEEYRGYLPGQVNDEWLEKEHILILEGGPINNLQNMKIISFLLSQKIHPLVLLHPWYRLIYFCLKLGGGCDYWESWVKCLVTTWAPLIHCQLIYFSIVHKDSSYDMYQQKVICVSEKEEAISHILIYNNIAQVLAMIQVRHQPKYYYQNLWYVLNRAQSSHTERLGAHNILFGYIFVTYKFSYIYYQYLKIACSK